VSKRQQAIRIIEEAMETGEPIQSIARYVEQQTGLYVIPGDPEALYGVLFFFVTRDGKRALPCHRVIMKSDGLRLRE
jgi:hypothetical protein